MSSCYVTVRTTASGKKRYVVRYRLGGRETRLLHGGSFVTRRDAQARVDLIRGELAAGRDPRTLLAALAAPPAPPVTSLMEQIADAYQHSRIDFADETAKNAVSHIRRILDGPHGFRGTDPQTVTFDRVQRWVNAQTDGDRPLKPSSLDRYFSTLALMFDFAGVAPNPARDDRVKLPAVEPVDNDPPTADQLHRVLLVIPRIWVLPLLVLEQTAMRIGELEQLAWGDVDVAESQFRVRRQTTKTRRPKWVQVPRWLIDEIAASVPIDDRAVDRRVFPRFTPDAAKNAMARACITAGVPHFHPHDLRHRRATIWHHDGVPAKVLAERGGWSRTSIALDVYSHLRHPGELTDAQVEQLIVRTR